MSIEVEASGQPTTNNWNPTLGDDAKSAVIATLEQLEQAMPFLIGLTTEGRKRLAKVGDRTRPFVADAVSTALQNPGVVPRSVDLDDLREKSRTLENLREVNSRVSQLCEKLNDTVMRLGSDLYGTSRSVYSVMKTPATVPGLNDRKAALGQRFAKKKNRQTETTAPEEAQGVA